MSKAVYPTPIEKTNVLLADSIFHESTVAAHHYYSSTYPAWKVTGNFVSLVRKYWNIVNCKTPSAGVRKRDIQRNHLAKDPIILNIF
uniref:Uncharacterized protein n=1 Tax=Lepeophtheirus salmonis TaxID=72036 RepID=A0A0K2T313_LEPSM